MSEFYNFLFGYSKKKFTAIIILQLIGWIILAIWEEVESGIFHAFFWHHTPFGTGACDVLGFILAFIFGIIIGCINGFFINLIPYVIELLESSASSLKVLKEKSESNNNNTDNT